MDSVKWLGFDWQASAQNGGGNHLYYASNYFDTFYAIAEYLINAGHAYVDSQSLKTWRRIVVISHGPGVNSPFRDRTASESLDLFRRMKAGEFADGAHILRAKIDMASPNMNMRDPAIYRIRHAITTIPATNGASTRCTTTRIRSKTQSKTSRTRFVLWSSRITARSTTGSSPAQPKAASSNNPCHANTNSRA
jgi:glutamyl/glutaminyl-tRNA synthetase